MNHIGKLISAFLVNAHLKKSWLAASLGVDLSYLVRLLKKPTIKTDRLEDISDITHHNFFKDYAEEWEEKQKKVKNGQNDPSN